MDTQQQSVALIVGVTGMVGLSLVEALKKPTALGGPWKVYGVARSTCPDWFPETKIDGYVSVDVLDFEATKQKLSSLSDQISHIFWVTYKYCETEEETIIVNTTMVNNVLKVLISNPGSKISHFSLVTGTKQYLGPLFDPVLSSKVVPHEPPFLEDSPRLPFPNSYYALEDILASSSHKFTWSVHRSSMILGASLRTAYNGLLTYIVYALICRFEGSPFRFPGSQFTWEHFSDATDATILAEQQVWAAITDTAKNQAFNCTNGDVYIWKSFWKVLCEIFDIEFVPFDEKDEFDWVDMMKGKGKVWDTIVEENGLITTKLEEITCVHACNAILHFQFQPIFSMNKSKEFGFLGFTDTLKSVRKWVLKLREMKVIPQQ